MWLTYPELSWRPRRLGAFAGGFVLATAAAFFVLLLEPSPLHAAHVFFDRTVKNQIDRESPFSLWDWRQYHARGIPNLHVVQYVLEGLLVVASVAFAFVPRRKSPLQLAAAYAALANGGTVYEPRLAKALLSADGTHVTPIPTKVKGTLPVSHASVAVAPGSVYPAPHSMVMEDAPFKVMTGAVESETMTVLVAVAVFPSVSVAV